MMLVIPLTLTFMTPAFLGESDPASKAGFRVPSLKGVLRYWWRQFQDQSDPQTLFQKESRIFGSTDAQSRVIVRVTGPAPRCSPGDTAFNDRRSGIKYLLYSCYRLSQNQPGRTQWVLPEEQVSLELRLRGSQAENQEVLLALYFAQCFGGLGYRSRRGAGSFQLSVVSPTGNLAFHDLLNMTAKQFVDGYRQQDGALSSWTTMIHRGSPMAGALSNPDHFREVEGSADQRCGDVLDMVGEKLRSVRTIWEYDSKKSNTFHSEARALHAAGKSSPPAYSGPNPLTKAAFGLPIQYRFKQRDPVTKAVTMRTGRSGRLGPTPEPWSVEAAPAAYERRASPLFINVKQDAGGMPYANLLILWNQFLPSGEQIELVKVEEVGGKKKRTLLGAVDQPTDAAIVSFLKRFP